MNDLVLVNSGGGVDRLVSRHLEDGHPQWAAGEALVYSSNAFGDKKDRVYWQPSYKDRESGAPIKVNGQDLRGRFPVYLDNGRIALNGCNRWAGGQSCGIFTVNIDGGDPRQLTDNANDLPTSNLGSSLLFMSDRNGNWDVFSVDESGSGPRPLT